MLSPRMRHSLIYNYLRELGVKMLQNAYKHPCSKHLTTSRKGTIFYETAIRKLIKSLEKFQFLTESLCDSEIIRTFASLEPAKPLHDAQMCGSFYILSVMTDENYSYPLLSNSFWTSYRTLIGHFSGHLSSNMSICPLICLID